jgi:hypothetical protein
MGFARCRSWHRLHEKNEAFLLVRSRGILASRICLSIWKAMRLRLRVSGNILMMMLTVPLVGCQTAPVTTLTLAPRESFFYKHPELSARYSEFYETSPEAIADAYSQAITSEIVQADVIKQAFAKYPDLVESLDGLTKHLATDRNKGLPVVDAIRKEFNPHTDSLFWYEYGKGDRQEQGYVIVRNGDFYRTFWVAGSKKRPDEIP